MDQQAQHQRHPLVSRLPSKQRSPSRAPRRLRVPQGGWILCVCAGRQRVSHNNAGSCQQVAGRWQTLVSHVITATFTHDQVPQTRAPSPTHTKPRLNLPLFVRDWSLKGRGGGNYKTGGGGYKTGGGHVKFYPYEKGRQKKF